GGGLGGGDVRQIAACDPRVSEIWSIRERPNEHEDFYKAKNGLLGSDVLLCGAFAAAPSLPPKPSPIEGEGCCERGMFGQLRDTALVLRCIQMIQCDAPLSSRQRSV